MDDSGVNALTFPNNRIIPYMTLFFKAFQFDVNVQIKTKREIERIFKFQVTISHHLLQREIKKVSV